MIEYLTIHGTSVPYCLKKNPKYHVRLIFKSGILVIETLTGFMDEKVKFFVYDKSDWIVKHYLKINKQTQKANLVHQLPEGKVWLLGKVFEYEFSSSSKNFFRFEKKFFSTAKKNFFFGCKKNFFF